jgi:hypothetical protein
MQRAHSYSHLRLNLCTPSDTQRSAQTNLSGLGEFVSTRICRVLDQECMQLLCDMQTNWRASQRPISVGAQRSAGRIGDRFAKVPIFDFKPTVSCPLTLVLTKRVLGVPLANEINELKAQPQRLNRHQIKLRVFKQRLGLPS